MGNISSTTDSLKRNTPDLTPVQNLCQSFGNHTRAAVSKIDVNKLNQLLPDQEAQSRLAKNAIGIALEEGSKSVPGGHLLYRIASKSLGDVKK